MTRAQLWVAGGALAPIVYAATVVLGGVLTPGYSHTAGPISALTMAGAPATAVLIPLFALYNALLMAFAFTMREAFAERGVRLSLAGPILLAVVALTGVLMLVYPMDPLGLPSTETGRLHVWFAGIASLATMLVVLSVAMALRHYTQWRRVSLYSFASLAAIAVSGIWAGTAAVALSPWMGLAERITIGAFLQWLLIVALALLRPSSARQP
jgi:Protein of unknown function (DUF998)